MASRVTIPAEWAPHRACWMAYPYVTEEWTGRLEDARTELCALIRAIAGAGREKVCLLVRDEATLRNAERRLQDVDNVEFVQAKYGDCWTRDTLPLFGFVGDQLAAASFEFNGWGVRFLIDGDTTVAMDVARRVTPNHVRSSLVLEGGALEFNGAGTCITTESCVLHANRNPSWDRDNAERAIMELLDLERVVWLSRGLDHDHTDGHVDMIARFVNEHAVLCGHATKDDPHHTVLAQILQELREAGFELHHVPSPASAIDAEAPLPANYCNYYVANKAVIVPTYGVPMDELALQTIEALFPDRKTIGLPAIALLSQGGAFHCVTQPEPETPPRSS